MGLFDNKRSFLAVPLLITLVLGVKAWCDHQERLKQQAQENAKMSEELLVQFSKAPTTHLGRPSLSQIHSEKLEEASERSLASGPPQRGVKFSDAIPKTTQGQKLQWQPSHWVRLNDTIDLDTTSIQKTGSLVLFQIAWDEFIVSMAANCQTQQLRDIKTYDVIAESTIDNESPEWHTPLKNEIDVLKAVCR